MLFRSSISAAETSARGGSRAYLQFDYALSYGGASSGTLVPIQQAQASASASFFLPPGALTLFVTAFDVRAPNSLATLSAQATVTLPTGLSFTTLNAMVPELAHSPLLMGDATTAMYNAYVIAQSMAALPPPAKGSRVPDGALC